MVQAGTLKPRSLESYSEILERHVLPALGGVRVRQLHRARIKGLLTAKLADGLSRSTVRIIHAVLRATLNATVEDGVLIANPALRLGRMLRLTTSKATRQEEIKALSRVPS